MKIHLVSDLHIEFGAYPFTKPKETDLVIAAGDISLGATAPMFLRQIFDIHVPIVYVAGNHEFYRHGMKEIREILVEKAPEQKVTYLEKSQYLHEDKDGRVMFIGATLWTDFRIFGKENQELCATIARDCMNDYKLISYQKNPWMRFTPYLALQEHIASVKFIENALQDAKDRGYKTVVVTHMAPHENSIHSRYMTKNNDKFLSAAYASDLTWLMEKYEPNLWVHGHVHDSFDYVVAKTRVVSNPRGYCDRQQLDKSENLLFNKDLLIEV